MMNLKPELIEKAKQAKSVEELLKLARENEVELTEDQAREYFEKLNPMVGELSDEELDNIAGGGCCPSPVKCPKCGSQDLIRQRLIRHVCKDCGYGWKGN